MKKLKFITAAAVALLIVACCPCRKSKSAVTTPLTGTEWKLVQLYGETVESDNYRMTLDTDGSASGVGDCNRFSDTFAINEGAIKFADNMVATKMFCPNQEREDKFFSMLTSADAYSIDGNRLMLIRNGEVTGIFAPAPAQ